MVFWNSSSSENEVDNMVTSTITATMDALVKGDVNVSCTNIQAVANSRGCHITFADQLCDAIAISNFTSSIDMDSNVTQDITNEIMTQAASTTEGLTLTLLNTSHASNYVANAVEVAATITQSFMTSCTRNVSSINQQTTEGCVADVINFAPQTASAEVIGDCVANQIGTMRATQSLKNILELKATSATKGIDLFMGIILLFVIIFCFGSGLPNLIGGIKTAISGKDGDKDKQDGMADYMSKGRYYAVLMVTGMIFLAMVVWWPGVMSIYLGIWPWPHIGVENLSGEPTLCHEGRSIDPDVFINTWMWYDPYCASQNAPTHAGIGDGSGKSGCITADDKMKHYYNCGLFATTAGCTDPKFLSELQSYKKALSACGRVSGATFAKCTSEDIASEMFAPGENSYPDCHKCVGTSEEEERLGNNRNINKGLWAKNDHSCASGISHEAYKRTTDNCPAGDDMCKEDDDDFEKVSPNECTSDAYHQRKQVFSVNYRACKEIQKYTTVKVGEDGGEPLLTQQCPPNPFDYFTKCRASDKSCWYAPKECKNCDANGQNCDCSLADPRSIASCRNELSGCCQKNEMGDDICADQDYQQDLMLYMQANNICERRWENYNTLNPIGWIIPLLLYIMGIVFVGYMLISSPGQVSNIVTYAKEPARVKSRKWTMLLFSLLFIALSSPVIGAIGLSNAGEPFPSSIYPKSAAVTMGVSNDKEKEDLRFYAWIVLVISSVVFLYSLYGTVSNWWSSPASEHQQSSPEVTPKLPVF